ncbi:uncharacterized protein LOC122789223 isoform X2 [Protopterus annectens]|uniref:uncharacterized protein LOC122789223 isoform X2 n=1 Tax=Protopterus annectens TaxID=7888 RepID=UPI001CFBF846|nr:uncharacterized protein LOC122789223 isoform X2 [Protopterus annectens]
MDSVQQPESDCQIISELKECDMPHSGTEQLQMDHISEGCEISECIMDHHEESKSEWGTEEETRYKSSTRDITSPIMMETDIDHTAVLLPSGGTQSWPHAELVAVSETQPPQEPHCEFCDVFLQPCMELLRNTNYVHSTNWPSEVSSPNCTTDWTSTLPTCLKITTLPFSFGTHSQTFSRALTEDCFSQMNMDKTKSSELFQLNPSKFEVYGKVDDFMVQKFQDMEFRNRTLVHSDYSFYEMGILGQQSENDLCEHSSEEDTDETAKHIVQESILELEEITHTDSMSDYILRSTNYLIKNDVPEDSFESLAEEPSKLYTGNNFERNALAKAINSSKVPVPESGMIGSEGQQMSGRHLEKGLCTRPNVNEMICINDTVDCVSEEASVDSSQIKNNKIIHSNRNGSITHLVGYVHDENLVPSHNDIKCLDVGAYPQTVDSEVIQKSHIFERDHIEDKTEIRLGSRSDCTEQSTNNDSVVCVIYEDTSNRLQLHDNSRVSTDTHNNSRMSTDTFHLGKGQQEYPPLKKKKKKKICRQATSRSLIKKLVKETFSSVIMENSQKFLDELRDAYLGTVLRKHYFHLLDSGLIISKEAQGEKLFDLELITLRNGAKLALARGSTCYSYNEGWNFCVTEELNENWYRVIDNITQEKILMKRVSVTCDWRKTLHNFLFLSFHPRLLLPYAVVYNRNGDILYLMENQHITGIGKPPEQGYMNERKIFQQILEFLRFCMQHKLHPGDLNASMFCTTEIWFDPTCLSNVEDLASYRKCLRTAMDYFPSHSFQDIIASESLYESIWETLEMEGNLQEPLLPIRESGIFISPGFVD